MHFKELASGKNSGKNLAEKTSKQKEYAVVGVGNALIDLEFLVSDAFIKRLGVEKNSMTLIGEKRREEVLTALEGEKRRYFSGGSAANTLHRLSGLGHRVGLIGAVGDDEWGEVFRRELESKGARLLGERVAGGRTGSCLVLISPDGNRTMLTTLGCAAALGESSLSASLVTGAKFFHLEGYMFNGAELTERLLRLVRQAKAMGVLVSVSASDAWCVNENRAAFKTLLSWSDVFFANAEELKALHGRERTAAANLIRLGEETAKQVGLLVATDGERGANLYYEGRRFAIAAHRVAVKDTTGAGDAFAAGLLDGLLKGESLVEAGERGAAFAGEVVSRYGAR